MEPYLLAITALSLLILVGCSSDQRHSDLDQKMADARSRPQGTIEPLPTYPAADRFTYTALALRSPFEPPMILTGDEKISGTAVSAPDQKRKKEPLELFNYTALSMVGTLAKEGRVWALISDEDGRVHRVKTGNYIGKNFGVITAVNDFDIEIMETVPDGKSGWINRPRTMAIDE